MAGRRKRVAPLVAGLALCVALTAGLGYAADTPSTINACKTKVLGYVRVVGASAKCRKNESALSWNTVGPKGDAGPPGSRARQGLPVLPALRAPPGLPGLPARRAPTVRPARQGRRGRRAIPARASRRSAT